MSYIEFIIVYFTISKRPALKDNFNKFQQQFEFSEGGIHEKWEKRECDNLIVIYVCIVSRDRWMS